ncbi:unnamed protein product [Nezara viridula]|uniref:Uncharacterized protein n=1 Tax=Nezara viridula TaxID=85310 RepID=A0A9P0HBB5_NEZVI|nr:unnamed protein product [Nezara viridula]
MLLAVLLLIGKSLAAEERIFLELAQHKALCPFKYRQDVDQHRLPRVIEKVECQITGRPQVTYVDEHGRYNRTCTCTEIITQLTVEYRRGNSSRSDKVIYPIGCMCVNDTSQRSLPADIQRVV